MTARNRNHRTADHNPPLFFPRVGLLIAFLSVLLAQAGGAEDPNQILAEAQTLADSGEHAGAAILYQRVVTRTDLDLPVFLEALRKLRIACNRAWIGPTFVETAENALQRVKHADHLSQTTRKELRKNILKLLADEYREHHQHFAAIPCYEELLTLVSESEIRQLRMRLAESYTQAGYLKKAADVWEAFVAADPDNRSARGSLARLYFRLGEIDRGLAAAGSNESPPDTYLLARDLLNNRHLAEAEEAARSILGKHAGARVLLGEILFERKDLDQALLLFQQAFSEADSNAQRVSIAPKLAECHAALGSLPPAVQQRENELKMAVAKDDETSAVAMLILLIEFRKITGDQSGIGRALIECCRITHNHPTSLRALQELGPVVVRNLLSQGKIDSASLLLEQIVAQAGEHPWTDCMRYAVLMTTDSAKDAGLLLDKLEDNAAGNEAQLYALSETLGLCGMDDAAARFWQRIVETKPDRSVYDSNAHARLGTWYAHKKQYVEAKLHFDIVNSGMGRGLFMVGEERFREAEVHVQYLASGRNANLLVGLLDDPDPLRRLAAVRSLGTYGTADHLTRLQAMIEQAPPQLKAALREAATNIRTRMAEGLVETDIATGGQSLKKLTGLGELEWVKRDPFRSDLRWVLPKTGFVAVLDAGRDTLVDFPDVPEILGFTGARITAIAFTEQSVWLGTSQGPLMFDRETGEWSAFAVAGRHHGCPVRRLVAEDDRILVTLQMNDGTAIWSFDPATRDWEMWRSPSPPSSHQGQVRLEGTGTRGTTGSREAE